MFETALVALIAGNGPITALIGTQLYPVTGIPDGPTYPYVTYQDIGASSDYGLDKSELRTVRLQFDVWSASFITNKSIIIAFRNLLSGYAGTLNDDTVVLFASRLNVMDKFDSEQRQYRSVFEYDFLISEA